MSGKRNKIRRKTKLASRPMNPIEPGFHGLTLNGQAVARLFKAGADLEWLIADLEQGLTDPEPGFPRFINYDTHDGTEGVVGVRWGKARLVCLHSQLPAYLGPPPSPACFTVEERPVQILPR